MLKTKNPKKKVILKKKKLEVKEVPFEKKEVKPITFQISPEMLDIKIDTKPSLERISSTQETPNLFVPVSRRASEDRSEIKYLDSAKESEFYQSQQDVKPSFSRADVRGNFLDKSPRTISAEVNLNEIDMAKDYLDRPYVAKPKLKRTSDKDTFLEDLNSPTELSRSENPYDSKKFR